ncbi:MAG TPA: proline dehydrogenase family protein [Jiangellaceae bacterium]
MVAPLRRRVMYALATNDRLETMARAVPLLERRAYQASKRYVAGATLDEAMRTVQRLHQDGFGVSLDLFGEGTPDEPAIEQILASYRDAASRLGSMGVDAYLEIVPSHLGLDLGVDRCRRYVDELVDLLPPGAKLEISAEESWRTPEIMELTLALAKDGAPVVATVQANLRRSESDTEHLVAAGVPVRLVKGAYLEAPKVAHRWGDETDLAYVRLAHAVHGSGQLILATHDPILREALLSTMDGVAIEMLLGVREDDAAALVARGVPVRIYAPYGDQWFRYWMRRVAEAQGH